MEDGAFFSKSEVMRIKAPMGPILLPQCGPCGLKRMGCHSPMMPPDGEGRAKILVVGEAPGEEEDRENRPFVGSAGRKIRDIMTRCGIDFRRDCRIDNALICRPPKNKIGDKRRIAHCRPHLIQTVQDFKPEVIILLGAAAVRSVVGWLWKEDPGGIGKWSGWKIPCQELNAWVCPTHHPARLLWDDSPVLERELYEHVRDAVRLEGRPWGVAGPPDWRKDVEVVLDPEEAAGRLDRTRGGVVAFDFENNCQKPDADHSEIVSCSVSDGRATFAFPWHGRAVSSMMSLLEDSNVRKIGANIKHEARWCLRYLGVRVEGWTFDTMIAAHALDSRKGITGLKFQAFALLGMPPYNDHITPFLKPDRKGGYEPNRVDEIDLPNLLLYNGLDSLLEFKIARIQAEQLGVRL